MNRRMIMFVYNDITTDARVQRAADALADVFELTLISVQKGKVIQDNEYKNLLVGGRFNGAMSIFETIFTAWHIIRKQHPDIVYCHDYYSAILAYLLIKTHYRGKIIYDAHELMIPEEGRTDKRLNFFYWFEKRIIKKVDLLICASDERSQIMQEHYRLKEKPLVVPNISQLQVKDDDSDVQTIMDTLVDFFNDHKLTVVYAGAVTSSRRIGMLVDATIKLHDKCKLLIVGKGDDLEVLKEKTANHPELKSAFTGAVPYKCLGSILSRCDIGFLFYPSDTLNNIYCASNKIYEYASVGLPMLANDNHTVKKILEESHIGLSTNDFISGLLKIAEERELYKNNCVVFSQDNPWEKTAERLKQTIVNL